MDKMTILEWALYYFLAVPIQWIKDSYDWIVGLFGRSPDDYFVRALIQQTKSHQIQWGKIKKYGLDLGDGWDFRHCQCTYQNQKIDVHKMWVPKSMPIYNIEINDDIVLTHTHTQDRGLRKVKYVPYLSLEKLWDAVQEYYIRRPLEEMKELNKKNEKERDAWLADNSEETKNARAAKSKARHDAKMAKNKKDK